MNLDELLELCGAATPGPWWRTDPPWGDGTSVHAGPSDDPHTATKIVCEFDPFGVQFSPRYDGVDSSDIVEFDHVTDDMAFIAAAREHFPEALRRVKELTAALAEAEAIIEAASAVDVIHFDGAETGHSQINVDRAASEQRLHDLLAARREKGGTK